MSFPTVSPIKRLWFKWKSLKLPWRRRWLAGMDLSGNTFWEFKDSINTNRLRRIAQSYNSGTPYADIQISPQWHQWLRHTRIEAPSMIEQQSDVRRQVELKQLAKLADERWAAKPSFLDAPRDPSQYEPGTIPRDKGGYAGQTEADGKDEVKTHVGSVESTQRMESPCRQDKKEKSNPWKLQRGIPGEEWQPDAWTPGSAKR